MQGLLEPLYANRPKVQHVLRTMDGAAALVSHTLASRYPSLVRPNPQQIYVSLTALCNLRCKGCLYGTHEFMPGHELPWPLVRELLDDVKALGIRDVRLYGGEPLLHKDLTAIVRYATDIGLRPWVTTNGLLLSEKFDALYDAGLRRFSFGLYGTGNEYDEYVRRPERFHRLCQGLSHVRHRYGDDVMIEMGWLLMRPTCSLDAVREVWALASRFETPIYVNLIHYSLPYFTEGEDRELQFRPDDLPAIEETVAELLRLQKVDPRMFLNSRVGLKSIPDWLVRGPQMRVPCTENSLVWVGADGTVQMCYVTFKLGNLHEKRLADLLFTPEHQQAARDCVALNCPNCHCSYDRRTATHYPTRRRFSA
jgi:molybdenum cofactor biosynthesis enzyme MoaA